MHVSCPHCRNPIEVISLAPRQEFACPSCGSSFHLESESTTNSKPLTGQRIGRFELIETVGHGAFGTVYLAHDTKLDRNVAIKVPRTGNLTGPQDLDRFLREARSVAQLRHPSIVSVHEVGQADDVPYLVSDFVQGVTLAAVLSGRLPSFRESASLMAEIADALQYAHHHGVVHRDVKPSNIMIGADGQPSVMDFGLAKRGGGEITMTTDGQVLGTPAYMSPEQARGESHAADARSDVYSLGVILYQLLSGELPFRGTQRMLLHQVLHDDPRRPRSLNDRIPRDLETICLKCLEKAPERRYSTAKALADDLRRYLAGQPVSARPVGKLVKIWRWGRRQPALASAGGVGLLALVAAAAAGFGFAVYQHRVNDRLRREEQQTQSALREVMQERARADEQHRRAQAISTGLALDRGLELCEQNKVGEGLLWMARGLELAPDDAQDLARVIRTNLAGWSQHLHPLELVVPHPDTLHDLAIHPEGHVIATACEDGVVRFLSTATGTSAGAPLTHPGSVYTLQFSPDGRTIATGAADGKVRRWDWKKGELIDTLHEHQARVSSVAFSRNGKYLASGSWDRTACIYALEEAMPSAKVIPHGNLVNAVAFNPAGDTLMVGGDDPGTSQTTLLFWDVATGKENNSPLRHHTTFAVASHDQNGRMLLGTTAFGAYLWSKDARKQMARFSHQSWVFDVAIHPDGRVAATASRDGTARLWDLDTKQPVGPPLALT